MSSLVKAVDAAHHSEVLSNISPSGSEYVDHKNQLNSYPPEHFDHVQAYRQHVLDSPHVLEPEFGDSNQATPKLIYKLNDGAMAGARFMAKPYYEKSRGSLKRWNPFPIAGWSEITNQAIYHAAGLGEFHQKAHVAEHQLRGDRTIPMVAIHMEPDMRDLQSFKVHKSVEPYTFHPGFVENTRKMAILDFLSNNLDRHAHNLLYHVDSGKGLAVDHGRSFQYMSNHLNKWKDEESSGMDSLFSYMYYGGAGKIADRDLDDACPHITSMNGYNEIGWKHLDRMNENYNPLIKGWWAENSKAIGQAFLQHAGHLKMGPVRDHIVSNFMQRKEWLDQMAEFGPADWFKSPVPLHQFGGR